MGNSDITVIWLATHFRNRVQEMTSEQAVNRLHLADILDHFDIL